MHARLRERGDIFRKLDKFSVWATRRGLAFLLRPKRAPCAKIPAPSTSTFITTSFSLSPIAGGSLIVDSEPAFLPPAPLRNLIFLSPSPPDPYLRGEESEGKHGQISPSGGKRGAETETFRRSFRSFFIN